ncbi:MAG: gliding motility-associated protein GldE [Bacteroidales bacterium]|jgi:gliding motility-associated protein GldE|nr:gliding motility-associated protein GldE [Bacteroidales bacterium]
MLLSIFIGFTLSHGLALLGIAVLLTISATVSGSETSIFSLSPKDINTIKNDKSLKYATLLKLIEHPKQLLATILIANNFVNVAIVIWSTVIVNAVFDFSQTPMLGFFLEAIVITALILLFGEVIPKVYAGANRMKMAVFASPFLRFLTRFFRPLSALLLKSTAIVDKRMSNYSRNISIEELSDVIDIAVTEDNGTTEKKFLKGIVKFGDIEVSEIMQSRLDVVAIEQQTTFSNVMKIIRETGYSRIPVFAETMDSIVGILHIKDLLPYLSETDVFDWKPLIRAAFFVPENKKIDTLLTEFQEQKRHIAIVVDEYGGTSGIITMEDVLEEIVGDINDEFDSESDEKLYHQINEHTWLFEGKISLNDFCKIVQVDSDLFDDLKSESESLAGLILEQTGEIPQRLAEIKIPPFTFRVESVDQRRIKKIRVTRV